MIYFDFLNPYLIYMFFVLLTALTIYTIFYKREFIAKHKKTIFLIATILLLWSQFARYFGIMFTTGFDVTRNLPFYMCRLSSLVLLYYVITKDKRLEPFLFFWGATGIAGIIYPNGPIANVANLTETFYIDHFLLTITPFFLIVYQGYKPRFSDVLKITGLMAFILYSFIPINHWMGADYFYLSDQSIFAILFPGQSSFIFATVHYVIAGFFFSLYYIFVKVSDEKAVQYL